MDIKTEQLNASMFIVMDKTKAGLYNIVLQRFKRNGTVKYLYVNCNVSLNEAEFEFNRITDFYK